jgi:hypothetical protein
VAERFVRPEQHETDTAARKMLASALPDAWVDRLDKGGDYGIDDEIEIFTEGSTTGLILLIQRKGFAEEPPDADITELVYDISVKTLHYAELFAPPVLLALVPLSADSPCFYYLWLQEYIRLVLDQTNGDWRDNKETVRVRVPTANRMPGDEKRLIHIAAAPRRHREWAIASRLAHEMGWAAQTRDWDRYEELLARLRGLTALFGDPDWPWSAWFQAQFLAPASDALVALRRGGPWTADDVPDRVSLPDDVDEQELLEFLLVSTLENTPNVVSAALATAYDDALAALTLVHFGDSDY